MPNPFWDNQFIKSRGKKSSLFTFMIFSANIRGYLGGFLLVSGLAPDGLQRSFRNRKEVN